MAKRKTKVGAKLAKMDLQVEQHAEVPVWQGPELSGVTQSLLNLFLLCRERCRIWLVEGLRPAPTFNHRIEYGSMWHECEHAYAEHGDWRVGLREYVAKLAGKFPTDTSLIHHWGMVCLTQFPIYLGYWKRAKQSKALKQAFQEQVFRVPYELPSGRVVTLQGKWDGGKTNRKGHYILDEHKTKGDINPQKIMQQLMFDNQTMLYLVALESMGKVAGINYNVVRRPLAGGKHSIRQRQNESESEFYERLGCLIVENPEHYFARWQVDILPEDIERFKHRYLNPILEQLCDWWECIGKVGYMPPAVFDVPSDGYAVHWQTPYGMYNVLAEGGAHDLDEYVLNGNEVGLVRTNNLFEELTDG